MYFVFSRLPLARIPFTVRPLHFGGEGVRGSSLARRRAPTTVPARFPLLDAGPDERDRWNTDLQACVPNRTPNERLLGPTFPFSNKRSRRADSNRGPLHYE